MAGASAPEKVEEDGNVDEEDPDDRLGEILRSLPRPLIPLLLFL
jgi:hypothetical protein